MHGNASLGLARAGHANDDTLLHMSDVCLGGSRGCRQDASGDDGGRSPWARTSLPKESNGGLAGWQVTCSDELDMKSRLTLLISSAIIMHTTHGSRCRWVRLGRKRPEDQATRVDESAGGWAKGGVVKRARLAAAAVSEGLPSAGACWLQALRGQ